MKLQTVYNNMRFMEVLLVGVNVMSPFKYCHYTTEIAGRNSNSRFSSSGLLYLQYLSYDILWLELDD